MRSSLALRASWKGMDPPMALRDDKRHVEREANREIRKDENMFIWLVAPLVHWSAMNNE